jgi:hypothetical protein
VVHADNARDTTTNEVGFADPLAGFAGCIATATRL